MIKFIISFWFLLAVLQELKVEMIRNIFFFYYLQIRLKPPQVIHIVNRTQTISDFEFLRLGSLRSFVRSLICFA